MLREAIEEHIGWAMLPRKLVEEPNWNQRLIVFSTHIHQEALYWQTWDQVSPTISELESAVLQAAKKHLVQ